MLLPQWKILLFLHSAGRKIVMYQSDFIPISECDAVTERKVTGAYLMPRGIQKFLPLTYHTGVAIKNPDEICD